MNIFSFRSLDDAEAVWRRNKAFRCGRMRNTNTITGVAAMYNYFTDTEKQREVRENDAEERAGHISDREGEQAAF